MTQHGKSEQLDGACESLCMCLCYHYSPATKHFIISHAITEVETASLR